MSILLGHRLWDQASSVCCWQKHSAFPHLVHSPDPLDLRLVSDCAGLSVQQLARPDRLPGSLVTQCKVYNDVYLRTSLVRHKCMGDISSICISRRTFRSLAMAHTCRSPVIREQCWRLPLSSRQYSSSAGSGMHLCKLHDRMFFVYDPYIQSLLLPKGP